MLCAHLTLYCRPAECTAEQRVVKGSLVVVSLGSPSTKKSPFFTNSPRPPTYIFQKHTVTLRAQHTHTALFLCLRSVEEEVGVALGEEVVEPVDGRDARGQLAAPLVPLPLHLVRVIRFGFGLGLGSLSCSAA